MIFDKLKAYGWMAAAIVLSALLVTQTVRLHVTQLDLASVTTEFAQAKAAAADQRASLHAEFRKSEIRLDNAAADSRKEVNDEVRTLSARNAALLERVRRAEAAGAGHVSGAHPVAGPGQAAGGGDGPELLGSLGEADVHEAERADVIRFHLASCYRQYDRAQAALQVLMKTGAP